MLTTLAAVTTCRKTLEGKTQVRLKDKVAIEPVHLQRLLTGLPPVADSHIHVKKRPPKAPVMELKGEFVRNAAT